MLAWLLPPALPQGWDWPLLPAALPELRALLLTVLPPLLPVHLPAAPRLPATALLPYPGPLPWVAAPAAM